MRERRINTPTRISHSRLLPKGRDLTLMEDLFRGSDLYTKFNRFSPSHVIKMRHPRMIPPVLVELGELVGLIYRSDKWKPGRKRNYIHMMKNLPRLVTNIEGTQLFIVGGNYHVTPHGIEG
jgi:hypothetical protein